MPVVEIDHKTTGYNLGHAYWLARAARLSYEDESSIREKIAEWGFDRCRYFHSELDSSLPIEDTQGFVAASADMIIVAFRGTEPKQLKDWLSDANALVESGPAGRGKVHQGFSQALDSVYQDVKAAVDEFRDNDQTLWFIGHSLGGALAMLASARMYFEDPGLLADGVYTFGQPRTCDRGLAGDYDEVFTDRTFRFVNNNDIVAQVPPEPVFHHVQHVRYFDTDGELHHRISTFDGLTDSLAGFTSDVSAPASDGLRDHFVDNYVALLEAKVS
ncbi:triacylglycerol lipase [Actinopolyspora lacussalsi]|nr:triacylglycerol lipase [Actinopolyspora lacussalsi]